MDLLIAIILYGILILVFVISGIASVIIGIVKLCRGSDGTSKAPLILIIGGALMILIAICNMINMPLR